MVRAGRRLFGAVVGPLGATHGPCNGHPTRRGPGKGRLWVGGGMGPCVGHVNAAMPTRSGPPRPFIFFYFLAAPRKQEPPRNGIKNRALLCFEVPVASGPRVPKKEATTGPRHNSSTLPRPRPVGHQSTPWPHQTPTKHPRGPAHHPARLWWPWAASGVAKRVKTGPWGLFNAFRPGWVWPGS